MWLKLLVAVGLLFHGSLLMAQATEKFRFENTITKNFIKVGPEVSMLSSPTSSLQGMGFNLKLLHAFRSKWAFAIGLSQSYSVENPGSVLFSSFTGQIQYAVFGQLQGANQTIYYENSPMVKVSQGHQNNFNVGASVEQLFLNASDSIVPATGFSLFANYSTQLWGFNIEPEIGFGQLNSRNNQSLQLIKALLMISFEM